MLAEYQPIACTAMAIQMHAERKRLPLWKVEVRLRHLTRVTSGKHLKDKFERVIVRDSEPSDEQRLHLLDIADRCPVSQTLERGSEIASTLAAPHEGTAQEA